jgi:hypothetical protein
MTPIEYFEQRLQYWHLQRPSSAGSRDAVLRNIKEIEQTIADLKADAMRELRSVIHQSSIEERVLQ